MLTNKAIAEALREAIRGERADGDAVTLSVELARQIADTLDPPNPPHAPREAIHTRPRRREETR